MVDVSPGAMPRRIRLRNFLAVAGPGLVVMLADTDAGSVITAAQSGAGWGYRLLWLQLALIPVLYVVQELTVRLGVGSGEGHAQLIVKHFGKAWGWFSVLTLLVCCAGALLTEFAGLAGVGALMGLSGTATMILVASAMLLMVFTHSYLTVERIALAVGAFELVFLVVVFLAHPDPRAVAAQTTDIPLGDRKYLYLIAANIGAVIMPWMVFFQQSAIVEKKLTIHDLPSARADTLFGAVLTQVIMAAVLVAAAATLGAKAGAPGQQGDLDTVQRIAEAITPFLGQIGGKLLFGLGLSGAALVAAIVVSITAARTLGEILNVNCSLDHAPREAPWFYGAYALAVVSCAVIVASGVNLVSLSVGVQVMNALLLPPVLGFLFLLARRLPEPLRLKGPYAAICAAIIAVAAGFGVYSGVAGLFD
jgi:Mn2+/Fe2+ NRAMP family transporter